MSYRRPFYFARKNAVQVTREEKNRRARIGRWMAKGAPWLVSAVELGIPALEELREDFRVVSFRNGDVASQLDVLNDRRFWLHLNTHK